MGNKLSEYQFNSWSQGSPTECNNIDQLKDAWNSPRGLPDYNTRIFVYICERESENDKLDPDYINNCECDEQCYQIQFQYYVAEIIRKSGCNFNIHRVHRHFPTVKTLVVSNCMDYLSKSSSMHTMGGVIRCLQTLTTDDISALIISTVNERHIPRLKLHSHGASL